MLQSNCPDDSLQIGKHCPEGGQKSMCLVGAGLHRNNSEINVRTHITSRAQSHALVKTARVISMT